MFFSINTWIIIGLFVAGSYYLLRERKVREICFGKSKIREELCTVKEQLKAIAKNSVTEKEELSDEPQYVLGSKEIVDEITKVMNGSIMEEEWRTFKRYIISEDKSNSSTDKEYAIKDIRDSFDADLFIDQRINDSSLKSLPANFTGLGLLGTFEGLTFGLMFMNREGSDGMVSSINHLLDGSGSAFITSLLGVLFSLGITIQINRLKDKIKEDYESIIGSLEQCITIVPYEQLFVDQSNKYKEEMRNLFEELAENISNGMAASYDKTLSPQLSSISSSMEIVNTKLDLVNNNLLKLTQNAGSAVGEAITSMAGNEIRALSGVIHNVSKSLEDAATMNTTMTDRQEKVFGQLEEFMLNSTKKTESMQDVMQNKLQSSVEAVSAQLKEVMGEVSKQYSESQSLLQQQLYASIESISQKFEETSLGMSSQIESTTSKLTASASDVVERMKETTSNLTTSTAAMIEKISNSQDTLLENVVKTTGQLDSVAEKITNSSYDMMSDITGMVHQSAGEVNKSVEAIKLVTSDIYNVMNSVKEGNKELTSASSIVSQASTKLADYQESFDYMTKETLNHLAKINEEHAMTLKTAIDSANEMNQHWREYHERYVQLASSMKEDMGFVKTELSNYQHMVQDDLNKLLREFDSSVEQIAAHYQSILDSMGNVSDSFIDRMNELKHQNQPMRRK